MENASKALLMAGGMLITIIIVGVLMMAWNNMRELPKTQEQIKEAEELSAFNKKYESYAKNGIRGSDVTTVINMAYSHNEKNSDSKIEVILKTNEDIEAIIEYYKDDNNDGKATKQDERTNHASTFEEGTYRLTQKADELMKIMHFSTKTTKDTFYVSGFNFDIESNNPSDKPTNWLDYYIMQNPYAVFKRKKFNCQITNYDNGRVAEIYIEEQ